MFVSHQGSLTRASQPSQQPTNHPTNQQTNKQTPNKTKQWERKELHTGPEPPFFASSRCLHKHVAKFLPSSSGTPNQYFSNPPAATASSCAPSSSSPKYGRLVPFAI